MTPPATKPKAEAEAPEVETTPVPVEAPEVDEIPEDEAKTLLDMVARMSPDQLAVLKTTLGVRDDTEEPAPSRPLSVTASTLPLDVEATKEMTGTKAAETLGVKMSDLLSFAVRAPLNVDGRPIAEKAVLVGVTGDGRKHAVEIGG